MNFQRIDVAITDQFWRDMKERSEQSEQAVENGVDAAFNFFGLLPFWAWLLIVVAIVLLIAEIKKYRRFLLDSTRRGNFIWMKFNEYRSYFELMPDNFYNGHWGRNTKSNAGEQPFILPSPSVTVDADGNEVKQPQWPNAKQVKFGFIDFLRWRVWFKNAEASKAASEHRSRVSISKDELDALTEDTLKRWADGKRPSPADGADTVESFVSAFKTDDTVKKEV